MLPSTTQCRRSIAFAWVLLATLAGPIGCDQPEDEKTAPIIRSRIILIGESQKEPTWPVLQAAAARFKKDFPQIDMKALAPATGSPREQQEILESVSKLDIQVICIVPTDAAALRSHVNRIVTSGRPVVTIGMDIPDSTRSVYSGPSEAEMGRQAAAACAMALSGRSQTVMTLHGGADDEIHRERRQAFHRELPLHGDIMVLKEIDCGGSTFEAVSKVRTETTNYPRLGCWVFFDDWPLRSLSADDRLLPLGCRMVVCRGAPKYIERMREGEIHALVTYDFFKALQHGLQAARTLIDGERRTLLPIQEIKTETISISELDWYEARWNAWTRGDPSPPRPQD